MEFYKNALHLIWRICQEKSKQCLPECVHHYLQKIMIAIRICLGIGGRSIGGPLTLTYTFPTAQFIILSLKLAGGFHDKISLQVLPLIGQVGMDG